MNVYEKLSDPLALIIFVLTLLLPIGVGFFAALKTKNESDFFIGGRAMGRFVVALSAVSSGRSSWLVLGLSGMAYKLGAGAVWAIVGYITVEALQFVYLGKRLRNETQEMKAITLLDYFESKLNDKSRKMKVIMRPVNQSLLKTPFFIAGALWVYFSNYSANLTLLSYIKSLFTTKLTKSTKYKFLRHITFI